MRKKTSIISSGALLTALSLVIMAMTAVFPTLQYTLVAMAGLLPAVMVIRYGLGSGWYVYAAASALAVILLPDKQAALLYILLFGHYPMLKSLLERIRRPVAQWTAKLALCNVLVVFALWLSSRLFLQGADMQDMPVYLFILLANVVFVIYDIGFSRLINLFYPMIVRGMNGK